MDIIVCYGFQVHIGKTGEAHEQEHVAHGTLAYVVKLLPIAIELIEKYRGTDEKKDSPNVSFR